MKIEIIPAILPKDFSEVEEKISLVKEFVKNVQIDVCDGQFVPNATWPYRKTDDSFQKILSEEIGLPGWQKVNFEIDLMVNYPEKVVEDWVIAGAQRIILHIECKGDVSAAIDVIDERVEIGLALSMDTPLEEIEPYKEKIQSVQLMGIDKIGFQGQDFDQKVIAKIQALRNKYPEIIISIDGGVSLENASSLIEAGANRLVVGSGIFAAENPIDAIYNFQAL